jgi:hypothetical protein
MHEKIYQLENILNSIKLKYDKHGLCISIYIEHSRGNIE